MFAPTEVGRGMSMSTTRLFVAAKHQTRTSIAQLMHPVQHRYRVVVEVTRYPMERRANTQPNRHNRIMSQLLGKLLLEIRTAETKQPFDSTCVQNSLLATVCHSGRSQPKRFQPIAQFSRTTLHTFVN